MLLLSVCTGLAQAADAWKLVWFDEFDRPGPPDPQHWTQEAGFVRNREAQYYTVGRSENARIENGLLILEARKEHFANAAFRPGSEDLRRRPFAEYTSASLTTKGLGEWRYGRVVVRAKLPEGRGVWPAIWMLGTNISSVGWPRCGEVDIMENVGFEPGVVHATVHCAKDNDRRGAGRGSQTHLEGPGFHIYAAEWRPDRIDFFVDGRKYFSYAKEAGASEQDWPFDRPCYLILNLAIGGAWGGQQGIDPAIFPQRFEIDYVRVYQQDR